MWIEVLPKKIIRDKVIISKNMNCPKKKNLVNTNKSNKNIKIVYGKKYLHYKNLMAEKYHQDQTNPPALPAHQGYTKKKKNFQANI